MGPSKAKLSKENMIETNKYPIDFDVLEKGDVISNEDLEKITGHKFGTAKFSWAVIGLQGKIFKNRGFTSTHSQTVGLRILVDSEASVYNDKDFHNKRRGMFRASKKMAAVDVSQLSLTARDLHERKLLNQSRIISAVKEPRRFEVKVEEPKQIEGAK